MQDHAKTFLILNFACKLSILLGKGRRFFKRPDYNSKNDEYCNLMG